MKVLVVTGGIGSGKSEACRILKRRGYTFQYDADSRAKALYQKYPVLLRDIEEALGQSLCDSEDHFVPAILAERIFGDDGALKKVENLLFPRLIRDFEEFAASAGEDEIVIFESATILEKPQFDGFGDKVMLIDAPFEIRLERAVRRSNSSREDILARMKAQKLMNELSQGCADPRIDCIVLNDGSIESLEIRLVEAMKKINI